MVCSDGVHFNDFVVGVYNFSPVWVSGEDVNSDTFRGVKKFNTLALKFNFNGFGDKLKSKLQKQFCF